MIIAAIDIVSVIAFTVLLTPCIIYLMAVFMMDFHLLRIVREFLRYLFTIKSFVIGLSIVVIWLSYRAISRYQKNRTAKIQFYDELTSNRH